MKKTIKFLLAFTLIFGSFTVLTPAEKAHACYPAYKCLTSAPANYTLVYQAKDRRPGLISAGVVMGGISFIGTTVAVGTLAVGTASAIKEAYFGSLSFKTYVKKSDKKGYKFKVKTIYYSKTNFKGTTVTKYKYSN